MKSETDNMLDRTRVSVDLNEQLHSDMRELAKRRRVHTGVVYEEAIKLYLARPENYLGKRQLKSN